MPMPKNKICPKCHTGNYPGRRTCTECGTPFPFKPKEQYKPSKPNVEPVIERDPNTMTCGLTIDGCMVLAWRNTQEELVLTAPELDLVRKVLGAA